METSTSDQLTSYSKTAHQSHLDLLNRGTMSDLTFIVGPSKERIPCHKAFLIARSPVFEVMFSERWNQDNRQEMPLENTDPKVFKKFLQFIYADTLQASVPEALKLLNVAHFYDVQLLVSRCEEVLVESQLTLNDLVDVFQTARKYDKIQLMDKAGDLMAKSLSKLQTHPSFSRLDKETLVYILKRNYLDMKEVDLFRLTVQWATNQSELTMEQSLEDVLPLIRFHTMTLEEFTTAVVPAGLLSQSTLDKVSAYIGTDAVTRKSLVSSLKLNTQRRRSTNSIHDLYPGDFSLRQTRRLQLENFEDSLMIRTRITGKTAMGIGGISVCCPARAASTADSPVSSTFKEFTIVLQGVNKSYGGAETRRILLSMSPVKVVEGNITEIQFDPVVRLADSSDYCLTVEEIQRSSGQLAASTKDFYLVKVFARKRNRSLTIDIINESVVIDDKVQESSDSNEHPQLICRLIVEKL